MTTVAADHDDEFFYRAGLDSLDDFIGNGENLFVSKAADNFSGLKFSRRRTFFCKFNQRREIFFAVDLVNMFAVRKADRARRENSVRIKFFLEEQDSSS